MENFKELPTWAQRTTFRYKGSVKLGTHLEFGTNFKWKGEITSDQYKKMLSHFNGQSVLLGTQHTSTPAKNSLAEWIKLNCNSSRVMTSYVGPILVNEGYATKSSGMITFKSTEEIIFI